jgi:hypothetical protein
MLAAVRNVAALYEPVAPHLGIAAAMYNVSAREYFNRSYRLYKRRKKDGALLLYCALELRFAIECSLHEFLATLVGPKRLRAYEKLWSAKSLRGAILELEPDFEWKSRFMNLLFEARGYEYRIAVPDLEMLERFYGRLNGFLHARFAKNGGSVLSAFERLDVLVREAHDKLWPAVAEVRLRAEFNDTAMSLLADLRSGKKTSAEIVHVLRSDLGYKIETNMINFVNGV